MSALKSFWFLLYDYNDPQSYRITVQADIQRVATIEKACLGNKFPFRTKKPPKNGFFAVFRSALDHFGICLYDSSHAQTYKTAVQLKSKSAAKVQKIKFIAKKNAFRAKSVKKWPFDVFMPAPKRFGFLLYDADDPETYQIPAESDVQRVWTTKKACLGKKLRLVPKTFQKKVFIWGFQCLQ